MPLSSLPQAKLWALVDCNTFYCSCERLFRPDLAGRPVAVLSNNDGCLVALTPEAKALGFKGGDVYFQRRAELEEKKVAVFSSNYALYGDISRRVMTCLETIVPEICQYSIDEAFIPLDSSLAERALEIGWQCHDQVRTWVGMPVRVGLGPTRTLAKLANHWAKKRSRVFSLQPGTAELEEILAETPCEDVWGIGSRLSQKLAGINIRSAGELRSLHPAEAKKLLTVRGLKTVLELNGIQAIDDDLCPAPPKSLVSSRSFGAKITDKDSLMEALAGHCETVGAKLRSHGLLTPSLSIFIGTGYYIDKPFQTGASAELPLTSCTPHLTAAARQALDICFRPGFKYAKAGVMVCDLSSARDRETDLFSSLEEMPASSSALMSAVDLINSRCGRGTIGFASRGPARAFWRMRRDKLSPLSTTKVSQLPLVKAG
ncbi:MAG: Y-family DNA polymerase [Deltaproteobacteria bacterium]|jgi:DNA polymerase V|nr:Y-family DNA polymerase [Deltaproteobacteria bacterium]